MVTPGAESAYRPCLCKMRRKAVVNKQKIINLCQPFLLKNDILKQIKSMFLDEVKKGLSKETHDEANVKCYPTFLRSLPDGSECGKCLGIKVNDKIVQTTLICLFGNGRKEIYSKSYDIPKRLKQSSGVDFFDHISHCLLDFTRRNDVTDEKLPLGLIFSFPLLQKGPYKAILTKWTKGLNCSGVIGEDIAALLKEAIDRVPYFDIGQITVLNNTASSLLSSIWLHPECRIAITNCVGTNACYIENINEVDTNLPDVGHSVCFINTEWGGFGDNGCLEFIQTDIDKIICEKSLDNFSQIFEKMISGRYIKFIIKTMVNKCIECKYLFNGHFSEKFEAQFNLEYLYEISSDDGDLKKIRRVLKELKLNVYSTDYDCRNLYYICECVVKRSAYLMAATTAALVEKSKVKKVIISCEGDIFINHPKYRKLFTEKLSELLNSDEKIYLVVIDSGSDGAALISVITPKILSQVSTAVVH